ncbi:GSK3B-interacting protein [Contarinia nasturtii]|uniref:GSK3B-interacting protein n=1 Tax=Contarinia nasturtii TaxID=265458 RepID=UPI0012D415D7|nr:GSK3B-interacting protein [Contarinia nasturtii]XP_031622165.1 GSK3B-interacting protein [Contarinia nasturtii]
MSAIQNPNNGCDAINWPDEANAVINDIKSHVRQLFISTILPPTDLDIYLNCETLESKKCTIRLSNDGFQIVSNSFDKIEDLNGYPYETPYALLNELSPAYINSFGNELTNALFNLQRNEE